MPALREKSATAICVSEPLIRPFSSCTISHAASGSDFAERFEILDPPVVDHDVNARPIVSGVPAPLEMGKIIKATSYPA